LPSQESSLVTSYTGYDAERGPEIGEPPLNGTFTRGDVERARRYRRPLYRALAIELALTLAVLSLLALGPLGTVLAGALEGLPWAAGALAYAALVVVIPGVLVLPVSHWRYIHERRWGLSTQPRGGWAGDRAKGLAVQLVLTVAPLVALVALARALPHAWPTVAAPGAAGLVLVLVFAAPLVLEPLFASFSPLRDEQLARDVKELANRAGVPVQDVLVSDASRRTRTQNAYVSGLGRSRRVVVYDTLLTAAEPTRARLVVAHELGHRRDRHVVKATLVAMAGAAALVLVLWLLLRSDAVLAAIHASGAEDPRVVPFVLLVGSVLELAVLPLGSALSRRFERSADRASLELTGDVEAFEDAHRELALANLADLDPPRALYLLLFTHPTPPERIAAAQRWAWERAVGEK
jgi:STE24 endopeptidase